MKKKLIIGSRSSDLALWQTNYVKNEIEKNNPHIEVITKLVNTKGDKILDVALFKIGDEIVQSIHDENTFLAVSAERSFLQILEGGCQVPVGALAEIKSNGLYLSGIVGSVDGKIQYKKKIRGRKKEPEKTGRVLANHLLDASAKEMLDEIYGTSHSAL